MHPPVHCHLTQARTACPDHHARRDALAHAARPGRRHRPEHRMPGLPAVAACRVLTMLGGRSHRSVS